MNLLPVASDEELLARTMEAIRLKMTPERRRVAIVRYDPEFAAWQASYDPLYTALFRLWRELTASKVAPSTSFH
jgi:hypothetical protein